MKITKDTKIGDLIPDGYKLYEDGIIFQKEYSLKKDVVFNLKLCAREVEVKCFKWYVEKYFGVVYYKMPDEMMKLVQCNNEKDYIKTSSNEWHNVSFESKIGLLKFICDDLNVDFLSVINIFKEHRKVTSSMSVTDIIPSDFIKSIFK